MEIVPFVVWSASSLGEGSVDDFDVDSTVCRSVVMCGCDTVVGCSSIGLYCVDSGVSRGF